MMLDRPSPGFLRLLTIAGAVLFGAVLAVNVLMLPRGADAGRIIRRESPSATATATATATTSGPKEDAYQGLASWVDIYDTNAWADPEGTVRDMAGHGVRTLFLQTGNSSAKRPVVDPPAQQAFIRAAHARGMKVVAWYLPGLAHVDRDFDRIALAVRFVTSDGQRFDSFALDIESTVVAKESLRNAALDTLSRRIRDLVGPSYPLGAIIPSPVVIAKQAGYWDTFPYGSIARTYDVLVPMGYYTLSGAGAAAASANARNNVRIIRAQRGCGRIPIHLIGGLAQDSTPAEVRAFAEAARSHGCVGISLYGWAGTTSAEWKALEAARR
jgi:hypothetical protein